MDTLTELMEAVTQFMAFVRWIVALTPEEGAVAAVLLLGGLAVIGWIRWRVRRSRQEAERRLLEIAPHEAVLVAQFFRTDQRSLPLPMHMYNHVVGELVHRGVLSLTAGFQAEGRDGTMNYSLSPVVWRAFKERPEALRELLPPKDETFRGASQR